MEDLEQFRERVRTTLASRYELRDPERDDDRTDVMSRAPEGHHELKEKALALQALLREAGLTGLTLPIEYGGQGLGSEYKAVLDDELRRFDTPTTRPLGLGPTLAFYTLMHAGTEEQKRRYLPPIAAGQELWCQMFSEPDAGSDLVSLRCRAERRDGGWLINGQKVWSSFAEGADFGLLLARSDPDSPKPHTGITMFIAPIDAPGVEVRPLVDMAGGRHFNEVYFNDVFLGDDLVIGTVNAGWQVANGTLGTERFEYLGGSGGGRRQRQLTKLAREYGKDADPVVRQELVAAISGERILEWLRDRIVAGQIAGGSPVCGSLIKTAAGTLEQQVSVLRMDLAGIESVAWDSSDRDGNVESQAFCAARQSTIAGGTHQIQRNLMAERILGLPR